MTASLHPVVVLHNVAKVKLIVDVVRLASDVGENEAVALMSGTTHVFKVGSAFRVVRNVEQEVVMFVGIRVCVYISILKHESIDPSSMFE